MAKKKAASAKKTTAKKAVAKKAAPKEIDFVLSDKHQQALQACLQKGTLSLQLKNVTPLTKAGRSRVGGGGYLWD